MGQFRVDFKGFAIAAGRFPYFRALNSSQLVTSVNRL